jgi:protein-disulfide isomerase-like protein with CxxC motif
MTCETPVLPPLRRPRILVTAARHACADYRRDRDLKRILGDTPPPAGRRLIAELVAQEAALDAVRRAQDGTYAPARHVEVLAALMAETALARADAAYV